MLAPAIRVVQGEDVLLHGHKLVDGGAGGEPKANPHQAARCTVTHRPRT